MSLSVKCALIINRVLSSQLRCVNTVSIRYYPRWTHRRPVNVAVENDNSEQELLRWKLKVERKVGSHNTSKTCNAGANSADIHDSHGQSSSKILVAESFEVGKSSSKFQNSKSISDNFKANIHYKEQYFRESNTFPTSTSGPIRSTKNTHNNSFQNTKEGKKKLTPNVLEKKRIYREEEMVKIKKLHESADKLGVPVFTDLGIDDSILGALLSNVKSRKKREKEGKILLEGKRLIRDALDAGLIPETIFFSRVKDLKELNLPPDGVKIYKIIYKKLCMWSDVVTPQGVVAILKTPNVHKERPASLPLTVICDNIRDPGNLGTILRTCAGVGCQKVILTKGCVDLWEPKVLRAAAGAHFRMSICEAKDWDSVGEMVDEHACICIAENKVAGDLASDLPENLKNNNSSSQSEVDYTSESDYKDNLSRFDNCIQVPESIPLPVVPYYKINYPSLQSLVLIVGGETEGVSSEAYQFATTSSGLLLNIPLSNSVESLNSGIALGVIVFEIKKQFLANRKEAGSIGEAKVDNSFNSKATAVYV